MNPHFLDTFHFCPRCGSPAFEVNDARSKRCADCGFTFYHNASCATVAVVFDHAGRLLVTRRALDPAKGTLDLPGGFVEPFETAAEACAREVKEETGLDVAVGEMLFTLPNTYEYSGHAVHTTDLFFRCTAADESALFAADDASEVRWLPLAELNPANFGLNSIRMGVEKILVLHAAE